MEIPMSVEILGTIPDYFWATRDGGSLSHSGGNPRFWVPREQAGSVRHLRGRLGLAFRLCVMVMGGWFGKK